MRQPRDEAAAAAHRSGSGKVLAPEFEEHALVSGAVKAGPGAMRAGLLQCPLGSAVVRPDEEHDAFDRPAGVLEHQSLELAVDLAAPLGPSKKRPADLHLAGPGVIAVKARGADHLASSREDRKRTAGAQRIGEELREHLGEMTIRDRVLLPD